MVETLKLEPVGGISSICDALGLSTATFYRRRAVAARRRMRPAPMLLPIKPSSPGDLVSRAVPGQDDQTATAPGLTADPSTDATPARSEVEPLAIVVPKGKRISHRALSTTECNLVLAALNEDRFCNLAPAEVFATLLDEGTYICSERTMYRILAAHAQLRERRNQLRHPEYTAPELMATAPNQLWSWDITKLKTFVKCQYFHLYVILDVYSRYVVGWRVESRESGELAKDLMETTCERQQIQPGVLSMHADNGPAMISQPVASLLISLDVAKSHSRPHVSDDNPFSEAQFKTLKYRPAFPERFASIQHAREFLREFFAWYNTEHHHSGLALLTPHDVHHGLVDERLSHRARVLDAAYAANPERFVSCPPTPRRPPTTVWINPPKDPTTTEETRA
jgi:putative transposase